MADDQTRPQAGTVSATTATAVAAEDQKENPAPAVVEDVIEKPSVLQTVATATLSLATKAVVYALGYWRVAAVSTWVLLPLMACVSVVCDRWREARRAKRRRAQLASVADERELVTASVAELPSWVFFPDVHRAEWLNQV